MKSLTHLGLCALLLATGSTLVAAAEPVDRVEHDCPRNATVIVGFGQSNSANYARGLRNPDNPKLLNFYRGRCYLARDPLLGATGRDRLDADRARRSAGRAGRNSGAGLPRRRRHIGFGLGLRQAQHPPEADPESIDQSPPATELRPVAPGGETDASRGTADYAAQFGAVFDAVRESGVQAPIYVAVATRCGDRAPDESLRRAQLSLPSLYSGVRQGPDTDALGREYRPDGCHLLAEPHARLWLQVLSR